MSKENPELHKAGMLPTITKTVLSMLADLNAMSIEKLLSGQTPEELIMSCKEKYDSEFDLHFPFLGTAGAHEIAWSEMISEFDDEVWG
ncbi:MAG: hypothetical protein JST37_09570 [Bacteroidetes bacterium]|nr:hypothetical protein [Bacteroidota bacterium]